MTSLADLFNPSFFIILGIIALLIALVVVYFESKMREQNHKIASMLSLVSTLAEDMNGVKMGLNHLAITSVSMGGGSPLQNTPFLSQNLGTQPLQQNQLNLIEVSDDESEDDESENEIIDESDLEEIDDDETALESDEEEHDETDEENDENIKVIKLNISENVEDENSLEEAIDFDHDDLAALEDLDDIPEISEGYAEEMLSLKYDEDKEKSLAEDHTVVPSASDLKTISINLGDESHSEHIEYKKLQLPKLRSIAIEKGLTTNSEAQKLKKPELLKLLGAE